MTPRQDLKTQHMFVADPVRWVTAQALAAYPDAITHMEREAARIAAGETSELVWLVQHPALYTSGTSAKAQDLVAPDRFPVFATGRGGQYTYHGPGQRVAYVMLDLRKRNLDVRAFVSTLEHWIIATLGEFGIAGETRENRVGVWVNRKTREDKIAALGIRVRHGVTFHGISINLNPNLEHFSGIIPCGVAEHGVTSFEDLRIRATLTELDAALQHHFERLFAPILK
jgi:lipoyl(octanoyl) transferase